MPKSVLITDDDEGWLRVALFEFQRSGFHVEQATSGEEAVELVRKGWHDAVVLDVLMPGRLNGIDALLQMRRLRPELPVLICTANQDPEYATLAAVAGAADYYWKLDSGSTGLKALPGRVQRLIDDPPAPGRPRDLLVAAERFLIREVMLRHEQNVTSAAEELGMPRSTLQSKLKAHGLDAKRG